MSEQQSDIQINEQVKTEQQQPKQEALAQLQNNLKTLQAFGGFDIIATTVEGAKSMKPGSARKTIFLTEKAKQKAELKKRLELWHQLLSGSEEVLEMMGTAKQKAVSASQLLKKNLKTAVDEVKDLEKAYRTIALFYKNTESDKIKNISIINANLEQIKDNDDERFYKAIAEELDNNYNRLDLSRNYSLMVIPGYLGSNANVAKWAKIAHKNRAMLVTDYRELEKPDDVMEMFEEENLASGDGFRSSVVMACNWLVGRPRYDELGEKEELFVAPSAALAGRMYYEDERSKFTIAQVRAGNKYGAFNEVEGVRFDLKKSELANLENMGLVPVINEFGKIMAFSGKTLFNGDNKGLQTYSVVRVYDWITKVLLHFLNKRTFENIDTKTLKNIRSQISKFLDDIKGPGRLVADWSILKLAKDPNDPTQILIDIDLTPFFPARVYSLQLYGTKGDGSEALAFKERELEG